MNYIFGFTGVAWVVALLFTCLIVGTRKRISQGIEIYEEAAKAVFQMPLIFTLPICTLVTIVGWIALWICIAVYCVTAVDFTADENNHAQYTFSDVQMVSFLFLVVAMYWMVQFFLA